MQSLKVRNFGKIKEAEIDIGEFTVFAGPNNTGKSFVSRLLYSLLDPMNADLKQDGLRHAVNSLKPHAIPEEKRILADFIRNQISEMKRTVASYSEDGTQGFDDIVSELNLKAKGMKKVIDVEIENPGMQRQMLAFAELSMALDNILKEFGDGIDEWKYTQAVLKHRIEQNLIKNFQIPGVSELNGQPNEDSKVNVDEIIQLTISGKDLELGIGRSTFAAFGEIANVVYLESPVYWKLLTALQDIRRHFPRHAHRDTLTGVPEYFYDIAAKLAHEYSGEMAYPEVYHSLVGSDVINGHVSVSERGEMMFQENGRSYSLQMTATGVANIGILAALIERKIIDRRTMLFIDEPEAHLHPSWQVVLAEALFQLAKGGVKVVVATHSLDILKWLEVHITKYPDNERFVALNHFPNPVRIEDDFKMKIAKIKHELSKPFSDLYLEGI